MTSSRLWCWGHRSTPPGSSQDLQRRESSFWDFFSSKCKLKYGVLLPPPLGLLQGSQISKWWLDHLVSLPGQTNYSCTLSFLLLDSISYMTIKCSDMKCPACEMYMGAHLCNLCQPPWDVEQVSDPRRSLLPLQISNFPVIQSHFNTVLGPLLSSFLCLWSVMMGAAFVWLTVLKHDSWSA